jgi:hypothetical protein
MGVCVFYFFVRILLSRPGPVGLDGRSGHLVGYCKYYQYSYCIAERYLAPVNFVVTHYSNWYWGFPHPRRACYSMCGLAMVVVYSFHAPIKVTASLVSERTTTMHVPHPVGRFTKTHQSIATEAEHRRGRSDPPSTRARLSRRAQTRPTR